MGPDKKIKTKSWVKPVLLVVIAISILYLPLVFLLVYSMGRDLPFDIINKIIVTVFFLTWIVTSITISEIIVDELVRRELI